MDVDLYRERDIKRNKYRCSCDRILRVLLSIPESYIKSSYLPNYPSLEKCVRTLLILTLLASRLPGTNSVFAPTTS